MNISVIIPVYNVEKYIEKCINSLLGQVVDGAEFIFVNDGSQDSSRAIVEEYGKSDDRIVIVDKPNGGLSSARNEGIKYVQGKYVLFLDSDDYLEDGSLARLYREAEENELDILQAQFRLVYEDRNEIGEHANKPNRVMDGRTWLKEHQIAYGACFCLYKASFLREIGASFLEGVYHEDMDFLPRVMYQAKRIMATEYVFYNYLVRESSISNHKALRRCEDYYFVARHLEKWADENVDKDTYELYFREYFCFLYSHTVNLCVIQGFPISDYLDVNERREIVLNHLRRGTKKKYRIEYLLLKMRFYRLYASLYRILNRG